LLLLKTFQTSSAFIARIFSKASFHAIQISILKINEKNFGVHPKIFPF
jgi:hypothetical protein